MKLSVRLGLARDSLFVILCRVMSKLSPPPDDRDPLRRLLAVMAALRNPDTGCPWDIEQSFRTIAPYTIEEAYEVAEAIAHEDMNALRDELGDLLLQVVYHARMAEEIGAFDFDDVAAQICEKMVRRHPHVFDVETVESAEAQTIAWEEQKARERDIRARQEGRQPGALDGVALGLPALLRAYKLQRRAARVGFDWAADADTLDKVEEEFRELRQEIESAADGKAVAEEFGDLLFAMVNVARRLDIEPEETLRAANAKFERRFRAVESRLRDEGKTPSDSDLAEMDRHWDEVKREERKSTV